MAFKDLIGKSATSTEESEGLLGGKVGEWLDEYKKAVAFMETFGFRVKNFSIDMSIPPQIHSSFTGLVSDIREDKIKQIIEEHQSERLTVLAGKALIMAKKFWERVESKQEGVELDVTLGLMPSINMRLTDPKDTMHGKTTLLELGAHKEPD
jgi:hypothetical protein